MSNKRNIFIDPVITVSINERLVRLPTLSPNVCQFIGNGRVVGVSRGEDFDIVAIKFGLINHNPRKVLVYDNHARRQVATLKKGYPVWVSGTGIMRKTQIENPTNPKITFYKKWYYMADDFNQSYVPTAYDVKRMGKNGELEEMNIFNEEHKDFYQDLVNDLLKAKTEGRIDDEE